MPETPELFTGDTTSWRQVGFLIWIVLLALYGIFSAILVYHWRAYATNQTVTTRTLRWYFILTGILFIVAAVLIWFL